MKEKFKNFEMKFFLLLQLNTLLVLAQVKNESLVNSTVTLKPVQNIFLNQTDINKATVNQSNQPLINIEFKFKFDFSDRKFDRLVKSSDEGESNDGSDKIDANSILDIIQQGLDQSEKNTDTNTNDKQVQFVARLNNPNKENYINDDTYKLLTEDFQAVNQPGIQQQPETVQVGNYDQADTIYLN